MSEYDEIIERLEAAERNIENIRDQLNAIESTLQKIRRPLDIAPSWMRNESYA